MLLKNSPQKSAKKLFASLVCLLLSFSKDLSAGKRYFVEVAVNCCQLSERQTVELVQLVVRRISRRLLQASLYDMLNNFNRLQMKINFF